MGTFEICWENKKYSFHWCCILFFNFRTDAFQFPLHCALVSVRRADKKVLPATLPLTDQLLLRARRTELNFYGQGGNSFHHTLRYGHIGHTPNVNGEAILAELLLAACHCSCQLMSFSLLQFLVLIEILSSWLLPPT